MALLSDAEVRQYHALGYLVPSFRLSAQLVDSLRDALERLIRDNPGVRPEKLISAHLARSGGRRTVPQIFVGDHHVGGFDDLYALDKAGKLDELTGRA